MSSWRVADRRGLAAGTLVLALGAAILLGAILREMYVLALSGRLLVDWATYANAFERWRAGEAIYDPIQLAGPYYLPSVVRVGFAYPPTSVPFFLPFASVPVGVWLWTSLNMTVFVTGIIAILRRELGFVSLTAVGLVLAALGLCQPFTVGVAAGNVNVALAGVFAWAWALGRGARFLPLAASAAAVVKLTPGCLLGWGDRRPARYATQIGVVAVVVVATLPLVGASAWRDFVIALSNARPICDIPGALPSVPCAVADVVGSDALARAITVATFVALTLAAWWTHRPLVAYAMLAAAWIIPVADVHPHSLLVPLVALLVVVLNGGRTALRPAPREGAPASGAGDASRQESVLRQVPQPRQAAAVTERLPTMLRR